MPDVLHCPMCDSCDAREFHRDRHRDYLRCAECALVFVPPRSYLSPEQERAEYDRHQNDVHDPGYRRFLSRLAQPLLARLPAGASGLDFGCGPGPALAAMLAENGHRVALYDKFYAPDPAILEQDYDFVCATEVVEHLQMPGAELQRLWNLLRPGGHLGIMTKLVLDREAFARWHYRNDPTHICFFSRATWAWWGRRLGVVPEFLGSDVILLQKPLRRVSG